MNVGSNIPHDSSLTHVTGQSIFVDDRPMVHGEVSVGIITSPVAHGKVLKIDDTLAKSHPDYLGLFTAKDIAASKWGTIVHDQPFLAWEKISYPDEPIALFASAKRESLEEIKKLIRIEVKKYDAILSIDEAIKKKSILYKAPTSFEQGDVKKALESSAHKIKGSFSCGGQEHFYLESQVAIAYPLENGQMEIHSSSQHPSETQRLVAEALGIPFHHVVCIVKRMGGGFGGKESQAAPIAAYAAVVAARLKKAARIVLSKDDDMKITGKRHPFKNFYTVGFDNEGKILALEVDLFSDGGAYADLSSSILERAMFHTDGAYYFENVKISGTCVQTHSHPNTAFRGFGGPQGNMTIESIMEEIAAYLGKDAYEIRRLNIYQGNRLKTPYGQVLENNMLPLLFNQLYQSSDYSKRLEEIKIHNDKKNGTLRGLSMTATKFGIAFTARFLNQGNALVNVQLDGTVQASTGATEMGQGVNTKIGQIVADAFGIAIEKVQMMPTSTEKNHNTSPTAASSGCDINGAAALAACNKIKGRLTSLAKLCFKGEESSDLVEYEVGKGELDSDIIFENERVIQKSSGKEMTFTELLKQAYLNRVSIGDYAHFKTPGLGFDKQKVEGKAFNYFTQGVAVSEVLVDEYSGEIKVLQTDILMDLGRMINTGIDRGQVTGAFIQGMGWVTTEKLFYNQQGQLLSYSPTTYKIPNIQDTPRVFNIDFIENHDNKCNIYRSKAVGEPPFLLATSVWTAIKHALSYRGNKKKIELCSPATSEEVLMELERLKNH